MAIFHIEGFETLGNLSTTGPTLETRINALPRSTYLTQSGGLTDPIALIDDVDTQGYALRMPLGETARGEYVRFEWPTVYKVANNASHPTAVMGFRYFNAATTVDVEIWEHLISAFSSGARLTVASNQTDLVWEDSDGLQTISTVLTPDEWHYIEIEYKHARSLNGGFVKLYVDGSEVYDSGLRNISTSTFNISWGVRFQSIYSGNVTNGKRPAFDDIYQLVIDGTHTAPLGPSRVLLLAPDADAGPNDWTRSTGLDNWALIDERTWGTADYVEAATNGNDDHYSLTTLTAADNVHALQIDVLCEATDGTPNLHIGFDDGTADEVDVGVVPTGSTSVYREVFQTNPSGGAWTTANVNSVEATQRMTE